MDALPKSVIQHIGTFLDARDKNAARRTCRIFQDIHAGMREHSLVFHSASMPVFRRRLHTVAKLMPCLKKLIIVFKNLEGLTDVKHLHADDLDVFPAACEIEVAFEYCDEAFMTSILNISAWRISFAYLWFDNPTETPVLPELRTALTGTKRKQAPGAAEGFRFSTRFNSKQAPSLLGDPAICALVHAAHYVVNAHHFLTQYSFMEAPHVIDIPRCIPQVFLELLHYNVLVAHPERVTYVSFIAQDFNANDMIETNRDRLMSWFNPKCLSVTALEGVDIYTLSFSNIRSASFARHIFETLRTMRSHAIVRIYNCLQSNCMCLLQQFPDVFVVLVAKTDHSYLIGRLVMHFLGPINKRLRMVVDESYTPLEEWVDLSTPSEIFEVLPAVLRDDWYWVQFLGPAH